MSADKQLSTSHHNGLAAWRAQQAEERRLKLDSLAEHRKHATTEVRDGREFTLVKIPDRYESRERIEPPVQLRGPKRKQFAA